MTNTAAALVLLLFHGRETSQHLDEELDTLKHEDHSIGFLRRQTITNTHKNAAIYMQDPPQLSICI